MGNLRERALKALNKPSPYGPDIDLNEFDLEGLSSKGLSSGDILKLAQEPASRLGLSTLSLSRASYVQVNESFIYRTMIGRLKDLGVIVMSTGEALKKLPWVRRYYWGLVNVDADKYTASVELYGGGRGYFIYVPPGVKITYPIYTCLLITYTGMAQLVHNIVIVDDGAELNLVTGCASAHRVGGALHVGVSEFYVGRNAKLTFAMIHAWGRGIHVRPRTVVRVKEGGTYVSYYVIYSDVKSIQQYPKVVLDRNSKYYTASIIVGVGNSIYDNGAEAVLEGEGSSAEIVSRAIANDNSVINARARIRGLAPNTKGHIECLGLLLSPKAKILAVPELESLNEESILTHEAAIGRIAEDEIEYLMSKGFSEEEAKSLILRGFMRVDIPGLPKATQVMIDNVIKTLSKKAVT